MCEFKCTRCRHAAAILKISPESGEAVCRACEGMSESASVLTLRALGFLVRARCENWPLGQLKAKAKALISHDRALRGEA